MVEYFIGWSKEKLQGALAQAQDELAAGQTIMMAGTTGPSGGVNSQSQVQLKIEQRIQLILVALNAIDPVTYPAASCKRVSKTRVRVYQGDC